MQGRFIALSLRTSAAECYVLIYEPQTILDTDEVKLLAALNVTDKPSPFNSRIFGFRLMDEPEDK